MLGTPEAVVEEYENSRRQRHQDNKCLIKVYTAHLRRVQAQKIKTEASDGVHYHVKEEDIARFQPFFEASRQPKQYSHIDHIP